jgi:heme exporter protein A
MRLSAEAVSIERGGRLVLAGLSFTVAAGEALTIMGPNGIGKSTLLRALAGFVRLAAGRFACAPAPAERLAEALHYIGHAEALKTQLTAAENLAFWSALLGPAGDGAMTVDAALDRLGLLRAKDLPATYLSAGQRRRLGLARLLTVMRPIWLLDEPMTALDGEGQALLGTMMRAHLARGGMVLAATHAGLGIAARELQLGLTA